MTATGIVSPRQVVDAIRGTREGSCRHLAAIAVDASASWLRLEPGLESSRASEWNILPLRMDMDHLASPLHLLIECADLSAENIIADVVMGGDLGEHSAWGSFDVDRSVRRCSAAPEAGMTIREAHCVIEPHGARLLRHLIGLGLDVNTRSSRGDTALGLAARHTVPWAIPLLLEAGADQALGEQSPLSLAAVNGDEEMVERLVKSGPKRFSDGLAWRGVGLGAPPEDEAATREPSGVKEEEEEEDQGGWWSEVGDVLDKLGCDLPVVDASAMGLARFVVEHVTRSRPVLLKKAASHLAPLRAAWRREALLAAHGDSHVVASVIPYAAQFGRREEEAIPLRTFIERYMGQPSVGHTVSPHGLAGVPREHLQEQMYVFERDDRFLRDRADGRVLSSLGYPRFALGLAGAVECANEHALRSAHPQSAAHISLEECWDRVLHQNGSVDSPPLPEDVYVQVFFGGNGSGAPAHFHDDALNFLLYGRKVWRLQPPAARAYLRQRGVTLPQTSVCVQSAGDAIFIPSLWSHETNNVGDVLGFAMEFPGSPQALLISGFSSTGAASHLTSPAGAARLNNNTQQPVLNPND